MVNLKEAWYHTSPRPSKLSIVLGNSELEPFLFFYQSKMDQIPRDGPILQIDDRITPHQHEIASSPAPRAEHPPYFQELAAARSNHFGPPDRGEDPDQTIHRVIEGAFSLPPPPPALRQDPSGIQALINHTSALLRRFKESRELEDVNSAIEHLRHLLDYPLEAHTVPRHPITTSLAEMLAARVKLKGEAGCALEDVNEILTSCSELLNSQDTSLSCIVGASQALTGAVLCEYSRHGGKRAQHLGQAIEFLREALKTCLPGSSLREVSLDLANLLAVRFLTSQNDNDYEEASQVLLRITGSYSPWDPKDSYHLQASSLSHALGIARSVLFSNLEDSEHAISRCLSFIGHSSNFGDPLHPLVIKLLKRHASGLSEHSGHRQGAPEAHSEVDHMALRLSLSFGLVDGGVGERGIIQTTSSLVEVEEKIRGLRQHLSTTPQGTDGRKDRLRDLVRWYDVKIHQTKDIGDIKEAIKFHRMLIDSVYPCDPSRFCYLSAFGNLLLLAYQQTNSPEYLHDSIILHYEVLKLESAKQTHFVIIQRLIALLSIRCRLSGRKLERDLDEIMGQFKAGVADTYAMVPSRFELACQWAYSARLCGHSSLQSAYQSAMSLMQDSLVFGPTLIIQHDRLVEKRDLFEKTPLNFASHQIRIGQVEKAIETLEQGRALLWSEMRGLRTSTDRLRAECPALADGFTAVNRELEMLTTSTSSSGNVGMGNFGAKPRGSDGQLHRLMVKQEVLLKQRIEYISQIRGLPKFKDFLKPPSFDTLCSAATRGVVIIITHCKWRSDIIIVLRDSPPSLIPTSYKFFARANCLKDKLITTRKDYGLESKRYADVLRSVLAELYELVGQPVIQRLKELRIQEQSRVWWCPTSVFGYLPLHAMGPIPSSSTSTEPQYFSDLFVSSYTPTLSALISSRNPGSPTLTLPNLNLLDAQPSPPARADTQVIQDLDLQVTSLTPGNVTLPTLFDELSRHRLADIGYHGVLEEGRPFNASLKFHNKDRLTILDVVRLRLPTCEFAFLPGSHTAELTEGSIPDEALHIAAAVQYSGVRSVIGSMWETVDGDGGNLARYVYRSMFSGDDRPVPYYEGSARALRDAVRKMRELKVSLVRWVNFVHFGA